MTICIQCKGHFDVTNEDRAFYVKIDAPDPKLCPTCRYRRRLTHRNEWTMYSRKCDATGKNIVALYPQNSSYKVYEQSYWRSDKWDARECGRDFDFSKSFFEQFQELRKEVPRVNLNSSESENSEYTNQSERNKNCYMCVSTSNSENCLYAMWSQTGKNLADIYNCLLSEYCYDSLKCNYSSRVFWSVECDKSNEMYFCYDCRGSNDCFMSTGLRNKSFVWKNEQLTQDAYKERFKELNLGSHKEVQGLKKEAHEFWKQAIHKFVNIRKSIDSTGDDIFESKSVTDSYNMVKAEDCRYSQDGLELKDCYDCTEMGFDFELNYQAHGAAFVYQSFVINLSSFLKFSSYCDSCFYSDYLFGCVGIQRQKYCILNKQYTKEEYEALVPKIISHMKKTGEWGQYFPEKYSVYGYNETTASEYFPLTKEEVVKRGWKWSDTTPGTFGKETISWDKIPDDIKDADESICQEILMCEKTGENFKIIKQELDFYIQMGLPVPRLHPKVRRAERNALRNPRQLWHRKCMCSLVHHKDLPGHADQVECRNEFETTYAPDRVEKVFCESCYERETV